MQRPDYRAGRHERAVKVYTVCDESRYLIVRNVPALGCIDELIKLFGLYGDIEEYRLLDEEDCEPFTDVYWIKYAKLSNSRFAKRKLDDYRFLGSALQVSYAPIYETLTDTKIKLEERRRTVLSRIQVNIRGRSPQADASASHSNCPSLAPLGAQQYPPSSLEVLPLTKSGGACDVQGNLQVAYPVQMVASGHNMSSQYFPLASMNAVVQSVREKLDKISDTNAVPQAAEQGISKDERKGHVILHEAEAKRPVQEENMPVIKKQRQDSRRRI